MEMVALYVGARMGGDFFDAIVAPNGRVVFILLDIAGPRSEALNIAAEVQDLLRRDIPRLFSSDHVNEAEAITALALAVNRCIIDAASGARCSPGFLASYSQELGTLTSINAGHMPGFVVDETDILQISSNGVPLGLFSHVLYEAQLCVLRENDAFVIASRGVAECHSRQKEFGIEGIREALLKGRGQSANMLCESLLQMAQQYSDNTPRENDLTVLSFVRKAAIRSAAAVGAGSEPQVQ